MKKYILTLTMFLSTNCFAVINAVDNDNKTVNYTPTNTLELNITLANVDDSNYAILSYNWNLNYSLADQELAKIKSTYPGYSIARNDLESVGGLTLSVPQATYQLVLTPLRSQNGFYAEDNVVLSRRQYLDIMAAKQASPNSYAVLSGLAHTHMDVATIVEQKTLTPSVCRSLYGNGSLGDVMKNLFLYGAGAGRDQEFKNDETMKLYVLAIEKSCYSSAVSQVNSVTDLLQAKLSVVLETNTFVNYTKTNSVPVDLPVPYLLTPWSGNK